MQYTDHKNIQGLLLLVDFEKAFDSISWKFLNDCLKVLRFGESFIKWINTFNTKIFASVVQCGHLSEKIEIQIGCRQGNPIAPYLFIICSQFLTVKVVNLATVVTNRWAINDGSVQHEILIGHLYIVKLGYIDSN